MNRGTVKIVENFYMPELDRKRTIRIYLPPDYEKGTEKYPVMYMHDAQNLFDIATSAYGAIWEAGDAVDKLTIEGFFKGIIIVGIDNGAEMRYMEYSPWHNEGVKDLLWRMKGSPLVGGEGFQYIDFIVNTLKPYIDSSFRTLTDRDNTAIGGSSMGGYISLVGGLKYQEVFSKIAAFSSAVWFDEVSFIKFIEDTGKRCSMKIYMDIGTKETSNIEINEFPQIYFNTNIRTYETLKAAGFNEEELMFTTAEGAIHNEKEWAKRFPEALKWIF